MQIKFQNQVINFEEATNLFNILKKIDAQLLKTTLAAKVNGVLVDLNCVVAKDATLELISTDSEQAWDIVNYSAGLVCAAALQEFNAAVTIANVGLSEEGYFVDFLVEPTLKSNELDTLSKSMKKIIKNNIALVAKTIADNQAVINNVYVKELVAEASELDHLYIVDNKITVVGQHIACQPKFIKENEIVNLAGAYWKDNAENIMLQRIYGMAHCDSEKFAAIKADIQDRKERDHRKIGKELEIFTFDNLVGQGLPIWLPNGALLKGVIQKYILEKEWDYDFIQVETPVLGTEEMYHVSGHWDHYRDDMFAPMKMGNESLVLRPMTCPHHIAIYKDKPRSYRELPLRLAEHAILHRYEASGALTGLERVRMMQLTDSHIFVRPDQIKHEFKRCFQLIQEVLSDFNVEIDYFSLSLRDPKNKEKYFDDDQMWIHAEQMLKEAMDELDIDYKPMLGEAAFYGPKLDIQIRTALNHEITVSTLQFDFLLPERFDLTYIDGTGKKVRPIILHRGLIGTYERFISVLLEQTKGVLPLWLAPRQIAILPVNLENHLEYSEQLHAMFKKAHIRSYVDNREERLSYKIREAQISKVPFQIVVGDNEIENNLITYRQYGSTDQTTVTIDEFNQMLQKQIDSKK